MKPSTSRRHALVSWLIWTAGFVSFPIAGIAGGADRRPRSTARWPPWSRPGHRCGHRCRAVAGQPAPAAAGRWILATAVGMGLGLLFGATVVGFGTSLADLALMGALTGLLLGVAQTLALPPGRS